jgi:hypothetical protein
MVSGLRNRLSRILLHELAIVIDSMKTSVSDLDKLSPKDLACLAQHCDARLRVIFKHATDVENFLDFWSSYHCRNYRLSRRS